MTTIGRDRYDPRTIALHWWVAGLIVFQWIGAHTIDWFPVGPWRVDARSVHIVTGVLLTVLLLVRVHWRLTRGRRLPPANSGVLQLLARTMHIALYFTVAAIVTLGLFTAWIRGDSLFGLAQIPHFGSYAPEARHQFANAVAGWHRFAANLVLVLAGGHMVMAIVHAVLHPDRALLSRMGLSFGRMQGSRS